MEKFIYNFILNDKMKFLDIEKKGISSPLIQKEVKQINTEP